MRLSRRVRVFGVAALLVLGIQIRSSHADVFQFAFMGEVASVDNPNGFFDAAAAVGAGVSGTFTYEDPAHDGIDAFSPFVTFHFNDRFLSASTDRVVRIGGVESRSSAASLTDIAVGDNNTDPLPPYFPEGDFYRYLDELDGDSTLFDFSGANLPQFAFGNIILADSTGPLLLRRVCRTPCRLRHSIKRRASSC